MPSLATFLLSLAAPLVRRVLIALGIGLVTYTGFSATVDVLQTHAITALGGLPQAAFQIASILGIMDALGITLGALATRLAITQLTRWGRI